MNYGLTTFIKRLMVMVFVLLLTSCGGGGDGASSNNDGFPDNADPAVSNVVWNSSNWDEGNWK